jgi:hypothetical protein
MGFVHGMLLLLAGWCGMCMLAIAVFEALAYLGGSPEEDRRSRPSAREAHRPSEASVRLD